MQSRATYGKDHSTLCTAALQLIFIMMNLATMVMIMMMMMMMVMMMMCWFIKNSPLVVISDILRVWQCYPFAKSYYLSIIIKELSACLSCSIMAEYKAVDRHLCICNCTASIKIQLACMRHWPRWGHWLSSVKCFGVTGGKWFPERFE